MHTGILMLADDEWLAYQKEHSAGRRAIFYASPNKRTSRQLWDPLFCVRRGRRPRPIVATGRIQDQVILHQDTAWEKYGSELGAETENEWRTQAAEVLQNSLQTYDGQMLAIELRDFQYFPAEVDPGNVGLSDTGWSNTKNAGAEPTARLLKLLDEDKSADMPELRRQVGGTGWQTDVDRRQEIERAAIQATWGYFADKGYKMKSVEKENCGWDLEGTCPGETLQIEVKGTAAALARCEVTPNEYLAIREKRPGYRLCIVCDALSRPAVKPFVWSPEAKSWCFGTEKLIIQEMTGARITTSVS